MQAADSATPKSWHDQAIKFSLYFALVFRLFNRQACTSAANLYEAQVAKCCHCKGQSPAGLGLHPRVHIRQAINADLLHLHVYYQNTFSTAMNKKRLS